MASTLSDEEIWKLRRGGHDYRKVYAAYKCCHRTPGARHRDPGQDRQGLDCSDPGSRGATRPIRIKKLTVDQLQGAAGLAPPPG